MKFRSEISSVVVGLLLAVVGVSLAGTIYSQQTSGYSATAYGEGVYNASIGPADAADENTESSSSGTRSSGGGSARRSVSTQEAVAPSPTDSATSSPAADSSLPSQSDMDEATQLSFIPQSNISLIQPQFNEPADIARLQRFLNEFEGESLDPNGVYEAVDYAAVMRFQIKYAREILDIWNLDSPTGYVGVTTRFKIRSLVRGQNASCPVFTEYNGGLHGVMFSTEIGRTQELLTELDMYKGPINNTWDSTTHQALVTFQETFREVMLDPWNISVGTGYKYKTTNKFLNYLAGCQTDSVYLEGVGQYQGL